jgi:hypothetical protein
MGGAEQMSAPCRPWWRNCALEADAEILEIDRMEDGIAPLASNVVKIRELISNLELCHHRADRWVFNIMEAIGRGETEKGLGTRPARRPHPAEETWKCACASLALWCAGCPGASVDLSVDTVPASRLLACLGERSPLKEWQVQRVIDKIRGSIHWPQPLDDPMAQYGWILLGGGDHESAYRSHCPEHYEEHEDHWRATVRTIIHDTVDGDAAELSLGLAIDMLWPCHWNFVQNLQIVLAAIGGNLHPEKPFAACGRNITLLSDRNRMESVAHALRSFCGGKVADREILALLGEPTDARRWLAASLDKTMRLQLNPPAELRAMAALTGPGWIRADQGTPGRTESP